MNLRPGLREANSCVKMILHAPSKPFFDNLSLMNIDIVILEYGLLGYLRNEKLHTPSISVRRTFAKHIKC